MAELERTSHLSTVQSHTLTPIHRGFTHTQAHRVQQVIPDAVAVRSGTTSNLKFQGGTAAEEGVNNA